MPDAVRRPARRAALRAAGALAVGAAVMTGLAVPAAAVPAEAPASRVPADAPVAPAPTAPAPGTSHYLRSLSPTASTASIKATMRRLGLADARRVSRASSPQVVLLQFGAQSNRAGGDGSGTGSEKGVRLSATNVRLTYPQVVAAVTGYTAGYKQGRGSSTAPVTVAVGTSSAGFAGATYAPADKGRDWADLVVEPAVVGSRGTGLTVVGASDIEAGFDATISEVKTWISSYLAAGPTAFVNNGAASNCPTAARTTGVSCGPVQVEESDPTTYNTWTQADYVAISAGLSSQRISVLPQIYTSATASQWENIALTAVRQRLAPPRFAGVLTSAAACADPDAGCGSLSPSAGWTAMYDALRSATATDDVDLPAVTDLTVS